jgi:acetolactate synthase I/II/III large subunit
MAVTHGRLTGKAGVCLSPLGRGPLNLTTGAAYALVGATPMVMITGQKGVLSRKQAGFQVVDIVSTMTPLTKMAHQIVGPTTIPSIVREAFREQERLDRSILSCRRTSRPSKHPRSRRCRGTRSRSRSRIVRAAMILEAERPLIMLGAAARAWWTPYRIL